MNVTQTVDIPASRRLTIDVPSEVPLGRAVITFSVAEATPAYGTGKKMTPKEAIEYCDGLAIRMGIDLSVDKFLEQRRKDRELEDMIDARYLAEYRERHKQ